MATDTTNPILAQAQRAASPSATQEARPIAMSSIGAIEEALQTSASRITSNVEQLQEDMATTKNITKEAIQAQEQLTSSTQIISSAASAGKLQAQNANIEAFNAAGGQNFQVELLKELRKDEEAMTALTEQKNDILDDQITGVQLVDEVINTFRVMRTDRLLNNAARKRNKTAATISNISAGLETAVRANTLTTKTINEGSIQAEYNAIEAEGALKAREMQLRNMHANSDAMSRLISADAQNLQVRVQAWRLELEEEQQQLARERIANAREEMKFNREKWKVELPQLQVNLERSKLALDDAQGLTPQRRAAMESDYNAAVKRYNDAVNTGKQLSADVQNAQAMLGLPVEERETIEWGLQQPGEVGEKYATLQELGGTGAGIVGLKPSDAITTMRKVDPTGQLKSTPAIKALETVARLQQEAIAKDPTGQTTPKTQEQAEAQFNEIADSFMRNASTHIATGDGTNPYQAPPLNVLTDNFAAIKNSSFFKKVLEPLQMTEMSPERILEAAVNGIDSGSISAEEAADGIETIFDSAAAYNNTMFGGYRRVGLPNQVTYNVQFSKGVTTADQLVAKATTSTLAPFLFLAKTPGVTDKEVPTAKELYGYLTKPTYTVDFMDPTSIRSAIVRLTKDNARERKILKQSVTDQTSGAQ